MRKKNMNFLSVITLDQNSWKVIDFLKKSILNPNKTAVAY